MFLWTAALVCFRPRRNSRSSSGNSNGVLEKNRMLPCSSSAQRQRPRSLASASGGVRKFPRSCCTGMRRLIPSDGVSGKDRATVANIGVLLKDILPPAEVDKRNLHSAEKPAKN